MYAPRYEFKGFENMPHASKIDVLAAMLDALVLADRAYLRENPSTPPLYASGVVYKREPPHSDNWQDIARTLELRSGDCEDLCAWRCAELVEAGDELARCELIEFQDQGITFFHVQVRRGDGTREDPSQLLGMR